MTYQEGLQIRRKWSDGAHAEFLGFQAAQHMPSPVITFGAEYLQQRWAAGFHDGKGMLMQDKVTV